MLNLFFQTLFVVLIFFTAGINKIFNFSPTVNGLKNKINIKLMPDLFFKLVILLVIVLEVLAPIIALVTSSGNFNPLYNKLSILVLLVFTILATLLYHFPSKTQMMPFLKNLAIIGGLWALIQK